MSEHELLSPLKTLRTHYVLTIDDLITLIFFFFLILITLMN
jgi:hypothetical protein